MSNLKVILEEQQLLSIKIEFDISDNTYYMKYETTFK